MRLTNGAMKRVSRVGVVTGLALLLLCELPWILALVGVGSLGIGGTSLGPVLGGLAAVSLLGGIGLWIYRKRRLQRAA